MANIASSSSIISRQAGPNYGAIREASKTGPFWHRARSTLLPHLFPEMEQTWKGAYRALWVQTRMQIVSTL
jgi:hypothetical protein